ncbi:MAG: hypothetical protein QM804_13980 [Propionicimonas sp.]
MLLAACSGPPATPSIGSDGVVSSGPLASPSGMPGHPNPVTPEPIRDAHKQAFTRATGVPDQAVMRIEGLLRTGPPCNVVGRIDVTETDTAVTVTVWAGRRPDASCDGPQTTVDYPFVVDVPLKQPLASRAVIDGAQ